MLLNNDNGVFITAIFTGHIYDTVIDVYFAQARFYDAKNRQWLNSDPMKDGLNWYLYVGANPATFVDPWGLFQLPYSPVRDVPQSYRESPPTQSNNPTGNTGAAAATVVGGTAVAPKPVVNPAITQAAKQAVTSVARAVAAHPVAALIAVGGAIGVVAAQSPNNTYLTSIYAPPLEYYRPFTACPDKTETEAKRDVIPAIPTMENNEYKYFAAYIDSSFDTVITTTPLTLEKATLHIRTLPGHVRNEGVMAVSEADAIKLLEALGGGSFDYGKNEPGHYRHYHPYQKPNAHIWFK